MNENLRAAAQHADWVVQFLSDANRDASSVESILLIPWIADARKLADSIKALIEATE